MSRPTVRKLLITTAFMASFGISGGAHAVTLVADGDIGAQAPAAAADGTTGTSATSGTTSITPTVIYNGAGIDATADGNISGQNGGNGGDDTDGDATGTHDGGSGGDGGYAVDFDSQTTPTLSIDDGISVTGGNGGNGGDAQANNGDGGQGGTGGTAIISNASGGSITLDGAAAVTGGNGGDGGTGSGTGTAGTAGQGGHGVEITDDTDIIFGGAGTITGGNAGTGGTIHGSGIILNGVGKTLTITGADGVISGGGTGAGYGIDIGAGASGATISNEATIGGAAHTGDAINVNEDTVSITNTGTVQSSTGDGIAVLSGDVLTTLVNSGGGLITAEGNALNVAGTITTITNSASGAGGITATTATGVAINVGASGNLDTITNTSGLITSANTSTTNSGTVVLGGDVAGVTLTGGTVSNTGSGNVIAVTADQTGAIASSSTLTTAGNAVHFENAAGSFTNTGTVTGDITSSAHSKVQTVTNTSGTITGDITLDDGGDTLNANGGTITGAIDMGAGNDTVVYGNASSATGIVGTIAMGAGANTLTINESMTTGGAISTTAGNTTAATVAATKTLTAAHNVDLADGSLTNNGTVQINDGVTVSADTDSVGAAGKYVFEVGTATTTTGAGASNGALNLSGGVAESGINAAGDIEVTVSATSELSDGANIRVVHGGAAETTNFTGTAVTDTSFAYDFLVHNGDDTGVTFTGADSSDIILEIDRVAGANTSSSIAAGIDPILEDIGLSGDTTFDTIQGNVNTATTEGAYNAIVEALAPANNNAVPTAITGASNLVTGVIANRMEDVRNMSSGSDQLANSMWVQGIGGTGSQDTRNGAAGYDADTLGVAIGADGKILDGATTAGVALSYANTQIEANDINTTNTDVKGYHLSVYGDHSFGQGTFVEGSANYGWNKVENSRHNVGGVAGLTARADYDAKTYGAKAAIGHQFGLGEGPSITPKAYAEYVVFNADNYTESGAGGANLTVNSDSSKQLNLGAQIEIANNFIFDDGAVMRPSARIGYKHDVKGEGVDSTASFEAGGSAFAVSGADPDDDSFMLGFGLDYYSSDFFQFTLDYAYESRDEYDGHTGMVRAAYRF